MEPSHSGRERRHHPRCTVELSAEIHPQNARSLTCRTRDICLGGVLLQGNDEIRTASLREGRDCEILLNLPSDNGPRVLRVPSRIVRLENGGVAVRFTRISTVTKAALNAYIRTQCHTESARGRRPAESGPTGNDTIENILRGVLSSRLDGLVSALEDEFERELWDVSEHAGSDAERTAVTEYTALFATARREQQLQKEMRRGVFAALEPHATPATSPDNTTPAREDADLELVDQKLFEMWLAKLVMSNRIEEDLAVPLMVLRGQAAVGLRDGQRLPIEPQVLADILEAGFESMGMDSQAKAICFHASARILSSLLGPLYRELSASWEAVGLKPVGVETHTQNLSHIADRDVEAPMAPGGAETEGIDSGESVEVIQPPQGSRQLAASAPLSPARAVEILASLPSDVLEGHDWEQSGRSLKARVLEALAHAAPEIREQRLERRLDERIGSSDRVLSSMFDDPWVPSQMKDWVKRFSLKYLTTAVSESDFFQDAGHPVKTLIDELERVYQFLPYGAGRGSAKDRKETERLMEQALAVNIGDTHAISGYSEKMAGIYRRYGGEYHRRVERLVAACEGRAQVLDAEQRVRDMLNLALAGQRVHQVVDELARGSWLLLLKLVLLRGGEDSTEWTRYWNCLMQIHAVCGGSDDGAPGAQWEPETLRADIQDGLSYIGFDPFRKSDLLDRVEAAIESTWVGHVTEQDFRIFRALPPIPEPGRDEPDPSDVDGRDWHRLLTQVNELEIGASLCLKEEGQEHQMRLVWKNRGGSELVFANPRGPQTKTWGRTDLARAFFRGEASALPPEVGSVSERATDATLREMQERIKYHETHDPVTGLNNLRQVRGALTALLTEPPGEFRGHVLGILELDHFDDVNSTCGYKAGERLLAAVGRLLEKMLKESTCMAYLGGSQFGLLLPATDERQGHEVATRIRHAIGAKPFLWQGKPYPVTASIGLMMVHEDCENPEALLSAANAACSAARQAGGNRVTPYREDDKSIIGRLETMQWWGLTGDTVREERIRLRGQLIAPTSPEENPHQHYEVLLSVYDESGGELPLEEFITSAEIFNMMADVDNLVIRKTLSWVAENPSKIERLGGVAINLSGQSLVDPHLVDFIRDNIERKRIPPALVSFEVTETTAIASLDRAAAVVQGIKALGCKFALDDFGTGLASYRYLKRLPVDYIKIDGSFVSDMLSNPQDHAIVKSINEIAHFMGKKTIAEHVENREILACLCELGVDYAQGYGLEKPVYLDEIQ